MGGIWGGGGGGKGGPPPPFGVTSVWGLGFGVCGGFLLISFRVNNPKGFVWRGDWGGFGVGGGCGWGGGGRREGGTPTAFWGDLHLGFGVWGGSSSPPLGSTTLKEVKRGPLKGGGDLGWGGFGVGGGGGKGGPPPRFGVTSIWGLGLGGLLLTSFRVNNPKRR